MSKLSGIPTDVSGKLPHKPSIDEIVYVEGKHTVIIDRWRIEFYSDLIKESLGDPVAYIEGYFSLIKKLLDDPSVWMGLPQEEQSRLKAGMVDKCSFVEYIQPSREVAPSLFVYQSKQKDGTYLFHQFEIGEKGIWATLQDVFAHMDYKDECYTARYEKLDALPCKRQELVVQMQQCAQKLIQLGMNEEEVTELLFHDQNMKDLHITERGAILLWSWKCKYRFVEEIKLAPLDKAVYILFLRHPEGINFSHLPDHREELMEIYKKLMNYRTTASMRKSVEDVTDPTKNSINEKCARIRRAFTDAMGSYMASFYYIFGNRGDAKKINLPEKYITLEGNWVG